MKHRTLSAAALALFLGTSRLLFALPATIDIDVDKPGPTIPPDFNGLMTEEINHSYDGGLFAELIQNRTFQDPLPRLDRKHPASTAPADPPIHWSVVQDAGGTAQMHADRNDPVNASLPISLRLDLAGGRAGVANDGYWGIPSRPDTKFSVNFYAKSAGGFSGPVTAQIVTDDGGKIVGSAGTAPITTSWQKYSLTLTTSHDAPTTPKAKFVLTAKGSGSVSFSMVSLFPPTYQDTPGGLRDDLMKLMADMHPKFIRLPGGNYVEGTNFPTRFNWKQMIGPADQRPGHMGCWSYRSSDGFGLPQYLLWCKQLGAQPVLALFAGYTLNHDYVEAGPKLQPYVDEAIQEIEYVSGPADSEWGKQRAADGFPEPFKLTYVEVGNEDWFDRSGSYDGRFSQFYDAIRAKYPRLKIIATARVKSRTPDVYDDHFYRSAVVMSEDSGHYDPDAKAQARFTNGHHDGSMDRNGPKIFCGEWATQEGHPTPDLNAALGDAAWLMGLERDADLVQIQCYAPLLVNVNPADPKMGYPRGWQWSTNLIGYDAMSAFGSPSYYALAMFGQNQGDVVLPVRLNVAPTVAATAPDPQGAIGVGTWHTMAEYKDIFVTAPDGKTLFTADLTQRTGNWRFTGDHWNFLDGILKPTAADTETWAVTGDSKWTNYTLHAKARKTGGSEGFLILYHVADSNHYRWWNIGGWGDTRTQLSNEDEGSSTPLGQSSDFTVQTGQWYDLRVEVDGYHVRCFVDDKLVSEATEAPDVLHSAVFASATYLKETHEAIVKVVNMGTNNIEATLNLIGAGQIQPEGKAIVLSGDPKAVNTIDQPMLISPKEEPIADVSASFRQEFPPHSLTLLRLNVTESR